MIKTCPSCKIGSGTSLISNAFSIFEKTKDLRELVNVTDLLSTLYKNLNQKEKEIQFNNLHQNYFDTLYSKENILASSRIIIREQLKEKNAQFNKSKDVIAQIENDVFFATPYFAISNGLNNEIISELDNDYNTYSNEDALEAGVSYIKNSNSTVVYQYFFANDLIDRVKSAIDNENSAVIKKLNTKDNKKWIEKFDNISSSVEDNLFNSISNKISENDENEKLMTIMEECISFSNHNEKLKHQYSNYVANYCISKVNDEKIDNFKALSLMKGAYLRSPNNPKIVKNFITLIRFNLMDILNDQTRKTKDIYKILDWVKNNMSQTFKQNSDELSKARREILQQLKKSGADISLFIDDNPLSNLHLHLGQSLNAQGLKMKRVLTYFKELGNDQKRSNPLDALSRLRQQLNLDDDLPF